MRSKFENNEFPGNYLLGDSGYACKRYILTPLGNPGTKPEEVFHPLAFFCNILHSIAVQKVTHEFLSLLSLDSTRTLLRFH